MPKALPKSLPRRDPKGLRPSGHPEWNNVGVTQNRPSDTACNDRFSPLAGPTSPIVLPSRPVDFVLE
ncbi:hypothetical protein GCM10010911_10720 [Paenibacillus nasutitermitis]|uniref:Uncharacterized protein n=1 Tax=Paenibacillus nasutitermitis TaxID=1652958 RepID=A0A917DPQ6_9BACL|nr:hypothetical protein GCM10010911_10720 [Paenibacillus nasutitermitis]